VWSKTSPGPFDRYAAAEPDEPLFILRGSDPVAALLVSTWVGVWGVLGGNTAAAVQDALQCSLAMEAWARTVDSRVSSNSPPVTDRALN
jgi:hypothetical protein